MKTNKYKVHFSFELNNQTWNFEKILQNIANFTEEKAISLSYNLLKLYK